MSVATMTRLKVFDRDNWTCRYCGYKWPQNIRHLLYRGHPKGLKCKPITVDHVIPSSRGGGNGPTNLVTACQSCNQKRGTEGTQVDALKERLATVDDARQAALDGLRRVESIACGWAWDQGIGNHRGAP